jgi:phage I-like protein
MASVGRVREVLKLVALSALIPVGDEPPREFRIFAAGENTSTKGSINFDEHAARAVMTEYGKHGADVMIDLEHLSLEDPARSINYDPDARGWAKLEIRNGELWAVDVHWTPEGEARLREKRQRYISPAFTFDPKSLRVTEVFNIAITALPATDQLAPLVAASRREKFNEGAPMNQEQLAAIAEALGLGADANVEDILATIAGMVKKIQDAANGAADAAGDAAEDAVKEELPPGEEEPAPLAAASRLRAATRKLARLSGKKEIGEVVCEVESWRASHLELEAEKAKIAKERTLLEGSERRKLVGELVKLGAEIPATAWQDADG